MIRSNVGNIVTNAQQIMSVGATTLAGFKARWDKREQDSTLNNVGQQQKQEQPEKTAEEEFAEVEKSLIPTVNTPENPSISKKVNSDIQIVERWTRRRIPDSGIHSMKDFYAKLKEQEGKNNADV